MNDPLSPTTTSLRRHTQYNVNHYYARQLMSTSSSYDYWWPYPPQGQGATTSTTSYPVYTSTSTPSATDTSTPALAFSFDSASMVGSSSASPSITSMSSPTASPSPSESVISISALPPSNSTVAASSHHKISMVPQSNLVYIVPACGVVGLLIGGITAWCVYGCLTRNGHGRRRSGRKSYGTLEVGPEYTQRSPRLGEKLAQDEDDGDEGEWVGDEKHAEATEGADGEASDNDEPGAGTETEGFLHPGSAQKRPAATSSSTRTESTASDATTYNTARTKSTRSSRNASPTPSGRTSLFFDRPDSTDPLPWESLRHKSIKRGILERLRDDGRPQSSEDKKSTGTARRPWQAHGRHDSDLLVAEAQADLARSATSVTAASSAALSRASTARSGPGFRIMQESPAATPQKEDVFGWPSLEEDRYTRMPARSRSRSPEKGSRPASPEKRLSARGGSPEKQKQRPARRGGGNDDAPARQQPRDIDDVLPRSPPRISSPLLDGALPTAERTPEMNSFASFGAPGAEEVRGARAGARTFRGRD
ncbi:hypothetical protein C8R46DRAFT_1061360 [Mycena filopes]|nr:hypothetical protein C8R46DRAFT_1061360 [Mycena filopes]